MTNCAFQKNLVKENRFFITVVYDDITTHNRVTVDRPYRKYTFSLVEESLKNRQNGGRGNEMRENSTTCV